MDQEQPTATPKNENETGATAPILEFDRPHYRAINEARGAWLRRVVGQIPFLSELSTAVDVACGGGYFCGVLRDLGFKVSGVDLRPENLDVCRERFPQFQFSQVNLDHPFSIERHDLVLVFGVLYHLQNPLTAIMQIGQTIGRIGIISTRAARGDALAFYLFREHRGVAHNWSDAAAVPTFAAYVAMFRLAGFEYLYLPEPQPDHPEWRYAEHRHGKRYAFVVSREPVVADGWRRIMPEPFPVKWDSPRWPNWLRKATRPARAALRRIFGKGE
jgi:SAM-dependent methyltransferase